MKDNDALHADLHDRLAKELLARLTAGACAACGRGDASHQELTVVRQFLADNGITAAARTRTPLHALAGKLPFVDPDVPDQLATGA
jgi:hypothetical protein